MTRFRLNKVAGFALIAGIVLSTTACGGPGGAARKACRAFQECQPTAFETEYSSMSECVDDYRDALDEVEREQGRECARAEARYYRCWNRVYIRDCNSGDAAGKCEHLWDDFWDACF